MVGIFENHIYALLGKSLGACEISQIALQAKLIGDHILLNF